MASIVAAFRLPSFHFKKTPPREETAPAETAAEPRSEARTSEGLFDRLIARLARAKESSSWRIPLIGGLSLAQQIEILAIAIALLLSLTLATFGFSIWDTRVKREQALVSNDLQLLSLRLAHLAQRATSGDPEAFQSLDETHERFGAQLALLSEGGRRVGSTFRLPPKRKSQFWARSPRLGGRSTDRCRRFVANKPTFSSYGSRRS